MDGAKALAISFAPWQDNRNAIYRMSSSHPRTSPFINNADLEIEPNEGQGWQPKAAVKSRSGQPGPRVPSLWSPGAVLCSRTALKEAGIMKE